jgi:hypothetical protein
MGKRGRPRKPNKLQVVAFRVDMGKWRILKERYGKKLAAKIREFLDGLFYG